jgi:hypothetical protein
MDNTRSLLVFERKPAASGNGKPIGGELLPLNISQLLAANIFWVVLLLIPIILAIILAKKGISVPKPIRWVFRLIPVITRSIA